MVCPLEPSWLLSHRTALARGSFPGDVYHKDDNVWSSRQTWYLAQALLYFFYISTWLKFYSKFAMYYCNKKICLSWDFPLYIYIACYFDAGGVLKKKLFWFLTQPWKGSLRPYGQPAIVNNFWEGKMMLIRSLLNPGESKNCWCKNLRLQRSFSFGWSKSRQTGYIG